MCSVGAIHIIRAVRGIGPRDQEVVQAAMGQLRLRIRCLALHRGSDVRARFEDDLVHAGVLLRWHCADDLDVLGSAACGRSHSGSEALGEVHGQGAVHHQTALRGRPLGRHLLGFELLLQAP